LEDDVASSRDPEAIEHEIEQTRAELADTIDAIAERVSPRRVASRSVDVAREKVASAPPAGLAAAAGVVVVVIVLWWRRRSR
jgi:hypothetical protein